MVEWGGEWLPWVWSWMVVGWVWLDAQSKAIGAVASIVFGISSAALAVMAYRLNKRNNYGDEPLVHIATLGGGNDKEAEEFVEFRGELWNRQKYTIYPKLVWVKFPKVSVPEGPKRIMGDWFGMTDGWWVYMLPDTSLKPHEKLSFEGRFPGKRKDAFLRPKVKVDYFDAIVGENLQVRSKSLRRRVLSRWRWALVMAELREMGENMRKRSFEKLTIKD